MTVAGVILEYKGSIQNIRKWKFIEIISLKKYLNFTTFVLKDTFFLEIVSGSIQYACIFSITFGTST